MSTALAKAPTDDTNTLLRLADQGDEGATATLAARCAANPALWHEFGDLAKQVRAQLVKRIAGENLIVAEAVSREAGRLRRAWAGDECSPLERALAERIAACWLHLHLAEGQYNQAAAGLSWDQAERHCKRIEQAERRYLRAIMALAQVRRLQLPAVQVNIAERQVNVGG